MNTYLPHNIVRKSTIVLTLFCLSIMMVGKSWGQTNTRFNDGYLTVFKVTSGATLTNTGTAIVTEEYLPVGTNQSSPNYSFALPTTGTTTRVVVSGSASSAGAMTRSENGRYLIVPGYNAAVGDPNTFTLGAIRTVNGAGTEGSGVSGTFYTTANDFRGAVSDDGTGYWTSGGSIGIRYTTDGTTITTVSTTSTNTRVVNIFNGQLFYSTGSGTNGIYQVGNGKPTTTGTTSVLQAPSTAPYSFSVSPDGLTIYAFGSANTIVRFTYSGTYNSSTFTYSGGSWSAASAGFTLTAATGVAVDWTNYAFSTGTNGAVVYACNPTTLVKGTDNGTAAITTTTLRTVTGNNAFRGLAFSPVKQTVSLGTNSPAVGNIAQGTSNAVLFQFNLSADEGNSTIKKVTVTQSGSATIGTSNSISNFRLIYDANGNGIVDAGETTALATGTVSGSTIVFSGITQTYITQGSSNNYLVTGDVSATATGTFIPSIASNKTINSTNYSTNLVNAGLSPVNIGTTAPTGKTLTLTCTAPAAPTVSITQPTCTVATATITVTAPTGTGITYSIDGTNYQAGTTFNNLAAGTTYNVTAKSSTCVSTVTTATVNAQPATPAAPIVSITQPTCTVATATITITAPTGTGLTYSIGGAYQPSATFNNVTAGTTYNVTVQNSSGCISAITTATVNAQPLTPAAPTVSITQPTCTVATGAIIVTAPTGTGILYSIDGTTYQTSTTFNNVAAGATYNVTAQSSAGCISPITTATVNAQPPTPASPTVSITQPTCAVATGTITVTAPTGTGITYSIGGAYQASTTFNNVTAGTTYNVTVQNISGCISPVTTATVNAQPPTPAAPTVSITQPTCSVATATITVTAPTGTGITYSIDGTNYQAGTTFNNVAAGATYNVTAQSSAGCISAVTTATVNAQPLPPAAPTVTITQPTCTVATGTITVTAPTGAGITYSIDGTNYQATTTFNNVAAGATYNVTAKSSAGCISAITTATVNAQPPTPAAPTVSITQPTCSVATGTITVTAPTGTGITYSIDGTNYQASATFNNVAAGTTYNITAQNSSGCISAITTATVNAQPATPVAPTVSITQPTCATATGTITVTAPTGTGITYSIDGTNYQASVTFNNVAAATTYNVTAQSSAGCISAITTATVNAQPPTPAAPTVSITQPTCAVATGTITVTAPTGAGLSYSIGGAYQASATFNNVTAGTTYNVTVQNSAGCISAITTATVDPQPATPAAPTVGITQPTCTVATATITVTAPTGTGITYSIDGTNYQASTTFTNVAAAATYNVTAQSSAGCISNVTTAVVNSQPPTPVAPSVTVTQPTCAVATGTIEVTAPTGTGITYSVDGTNYQAGTTFSGLIPGSYNVTAKNSTGCISPATPVTIIAQPGTPAAPTVNIDQPTCTVATGTITVTAPAGAGFTYSIDGTNYQAGTTFNNVTSATTYNVTVQNSSGCTSTATAATVNSQPPTPAAPTVNITQPTCAVATATITVTAPTGGGISYSIDGTNYQASATFNNVAAGATYNVTAQSSAGCISNITTAAVNAQPATPAAPTVSITQPTCAIATGTITVTAPTGTGITYSIDGTNYQASATFSNVTAGTTYNVTAKSSAGCVSAITTATVNAQPPTPAAPAVSITQPTCAVATGTITVTAPTGTGITYSIDGTNYQASNTFANVAAGATYNVTAQNSSGCISAITTATVNAQPPSPVISTQPSTTAQNVCQNGTATALSVTASGTGLTYQWYSNTTQSNSGGTSLGTAGNASSYTPSTATTGTLYYYVVVINSSSCSTTSNVSGAVTVNPYATITLTSAPGTNNQSVIQGNPITNITYTVTGGTGATLTAGAFPTGVTGVYSAGTYTISGTPTVGGTFNYTVTTTSASGCNSSVSGTITVCAIPTQASSITFTNTLSNSVTVGWTNGSGDGRVVIMNTANSFINPMNSTSLPTANPVYNGTGQQVVYTGSGNSVGVSGLDASTTYWFRVYEYASCTGTYVYNTDTSLVVSGGKTTNPLSVKTSAAAVMQSNFTSVLTPQYMTAASSNARLPIMFRATITGLKPNTNYRYYTSGVTNSTANGGTVDFGSTSGSTGAGNPLFISTTNFVYKYSSGSSLTNVTGYDSLTTDASGNFTGWFGLISTGNGRFNAGNTVYPAITLGNSIGTVLYRFALNVSVTPLAFSATSAATNGSFLKSKTNATPKNLVALFDNVSATGRPLSVTPVEYIANTGTGFGSGTPPVSTRTLLYDSSNGAWNAIIPNVNTNGVRAIEQLSDTTGNVLGCIATDADGQWATGRIKTSNPANGSTTALVIDGADDPLATCPVYPTTAVQQGTTPYASNSTYTYSNTVVNTNNDVTFTINNAGSGPLTISGLNVTSNVTGVYTLQSTAPATIAAGSSATFVVRFKPNSATTFTGKITITTNDTALANNPYIVNLSGTGYNIPVISVSQGGTPYPSNSTYSYPNTVVGSNTDATFTITNTGGAALNISSINVTNAGATVYTLQGTAPTTVAANSSATFVVRFAPNSGNTFTGTAVINSDDPNQGTYTINLNGTGTNTVITTGTISGSPFCVSASAGAAVSVPFTYTPIDAYTTFTAQLSDGSGSFTSPVTIGSVSSDGTGSQTISATIPAGTTAGNNYRIRVISTSPAVTGSTSSSILVVSNPVTPSVSITRSPSTATVCSGSPVTFTATPTNGGSTPTYQWYDGGVLVSGVTGNTYTVNAPVDGEQVYAVLTTSVNCYASLTATSNTLTLTVSNPIIIALTSGAGSDGQTVTQGVAINDITYAVSGGPTTVTLSGTLPTGVTGNYNGGVYTISGTPTQTGTFNYTINATGGCNNNPTASGSITVSTARIILDDNGTQVTIKNITTGSAKNVLSTFQITNNLALATTLTQVKTPLSSNYKAADIAGFKLFTNTVNNLTSATQLGTTQSSTSTGTGETVTFGFSQTLATNTTYYYWLTADITTTAQTADSIIASANTASNFTFSGSPAVTGSVSKAGAQIIASGAVTPGLLTVLRLGNGLTTPSAAALDVNVFQYNTAGTAQNGVLLKTLPTTVTTATGANRALTQSATATSEGALNLSVNGRLLTLVGYNAIPGTANVATGGTATSSNQVDDVVVGKVDAFLNVSTVTSFARPTAYTGNNIRSAVTVDGKSYWTSGPATNGGVRYILDSTSSATSTQSTQVSALNSRVLSIVNGQLYASTGTTTPPGGGIYTVGTGLPTATATATLLPTASTPNPYSFVFLNTDPSSATPNLLYVTGLNSVKTDNGIFKYYFDGTSWVAKGSNNLGSIAGKATSAFGIAGTVDASGNIVLYVTTSGPDTANVKADRLNKYIDNSAPSANLNLSPGVELAYSGPKYTFGGVTFTPTANGDTVITTSGVQLTGIYRNITIASGGSATLTGNVQTLGSVSVRAGGTLDCGAYTVSGYSSDFRSYFRIDSLGTLITSNPAGISATGTTGSIQTSVFTNNSNTGLSSSRDFSSGANYVYTAPIAQNTGIALPSVLNGNLTINADNSVQFNNTKQTINGTLTLTSGALVLPASDTLTLSGAVTHTSGSITTNATSNLILNGSATKALSFTVTGNTIHNVTINATATAVSLDNALNITSGTNYGTVICNGALNTNGYLTLKSDELGTAAVGQSAGTITGDATVERFTNGNLNQGLSRRAWRFLTSPVINGQNIHQAWQENGDNNTGFGTLITGYHMPDSATAAAQGYDFTGANFDASIKHYIPASNSWVPLSSDNSITGTLIPVRKEQAYMLFVRGDRSINISGSSIATLRAKGGLLQGNVTIPLTGGIYTVIGNPYASSIDFSSLHTNPSNSAVIKDQFYLWNSKLGTYGAYVLVTHTGTGANAGGYQAIPSSLSGLGTQNNDAYRYIPSGSGFFVSPATGVTSGNVIIQESDKAPGNVPPISPFRVVSSPSNVRQLRVNLNQRTDDTTVTLADGFLALFSADYEGNEEDNSARKIYNFNENLNLVSGGKSHIVEAHGEVKKTDTLFMRMWYVTKRAYQLQMKADNMAGVRGWLVDNYLSTKQELSLGGSVTTINFEVNADSLSAKSDRFMIVFDNTASALPVTITKVSAQQKNGGAEINWSVSNEVNIKNYTVEKSTDDGRTFIAVGTQQAAHNNPQAALTSYSAFDAQPEIGDNYYRIRIEGKDGSVTYSEIVKATIGNAGSGIEIVIYPNPVRDGKVNLQLSNLKTGTYLVGVYSGSGQTVYQKQVTIAQPNTTQSEQLLIGNSLAQGSYQIKITDNKGVTITETQVIISR